MVPVGQPPESDFTLAQAGRFSMAFCVAAVSFNELSSSSGATAFVIESVRPPIDEVSVDGSAAIFFASSVMAGPAEPNAVTTFVANASPPAKVGGGNCFNESDVLVIEVPSAPKRTTSFLTAVVGSEAALVPRDWSDPDAVNTGVSPPQKAVNHAALCASSPPEASPTVESATELAAEDIAEPLLAAPEAGAPEDISLAAALEAALDMALTAALGAAADEAALGAAAEEAALVPGVAVPLVRTTTGDEQGRPRECSNQAAGALHSFPFHGCHDGIEFPTCVSALGPVLPSPQRSHAKHAGSN